MRIGQNLTCRCSLMSVVCSSCFEKRCDTLLERLEPAKVSLLTFVQAVVAAAAFVALQHDEQSDSGFGFVIDLERAL